MKQHDSCIPEPFHEQHFCIKIRQCLQTACKEVIRKCLWLYYAAQKENTPLWAKAIIYSALAYFILPIDALPDTIPGVGYSDDLIAITTAIASVSLFIDEEVKEQTEKWINDWLTED